MVKRQSKAQKFNDLANAVNQMRRGEKVKRIGAKDGSIRIHAVVSVDSKKLEHEVLADCLSWLKKHHVFCNRHDCGSGDIVGAGMATYGIRSAGDIIGILKPNGRHFEIETKRGSGGRLSVGQQQRLKDVHDNGGLYFICHGIEEIEYLMGDYV